MAMIWHGEAFEKDLLRTMHKRMVKATLLVERVAKHSMRKGGRSVSGFSKTVGRRRVGKRGEKLSRINTFRSKPGEPPRTQTATLVRSITHEVEPSLSVAMSSLHTRFRGFVGRVGSNLVYARPLEFGYPPNNLAPRPWLRPAYHRSMGGIKAIFRRPMDRI